MRTEPKASYRTVQYEYAYRYTPTIYLSIYIYLYIYIYIFFFFFFLSSQQVQGISFILFYYKNKIKQ